MVRELHGSPASTATADVDDVAEGRPRPVVPRRDDARDLDPEDLVLKDDPKKNRPKRPRNKRHGRR